MGDRFSLLQIHLPPRVADWIGVLAVSRVGNRAISPPAGIIAVYGLTGIACQGTWMIGSQCRREPSW